MEIGQLKVQNMANPLGICSKIPVFSYRLSGGGQEYTFRTGQVLPEGRHSDLAQKHTPEGGHPGMAQKHAPKAIIQEAYRILVASAPQLLQQGTGDLWDSGTVKSSAVSGIPYGGKPLESRQRFWWKVKIWDTQGQDLGWSKVAFGEMGLFPKDWQGKWIGQGDDFTGNKSAAPIFICDFQASLAEMSYARLYISGLGLYRASLNGKALSDTLFDPGECDATKTVYYATYDVTEFLQEEANTLGIILGNGQYTNFQINPVMRLANGTLIEPHRYQKNDGGFVKPGIAGEKKLIAQLEITRKDGTRRIAAISNEEWKWSASPIVFQNWYGGEDYDATKKQAGWDTPCGSRKGWQRALAMKAPEGELTGREFPPIRIMERFLPADVRKAKNGNWLVDMGRNGAGFAELHLSGTKPEQYGKWIQMYPAEMLTDDGEGVDQSSCTQSWSKWYQCSIQNAYRIKGCGQEIWHPIFCYQGFQYLEVKGYDGELTRENFRYCIVRTENEKEGTFESSEVSLNQINAMVEHSIESNMFSAFTDCPQIEKLGWIETSHLMFPSMTGTYDIRAWMKKIIHDILDSQLDSVQAAIPGNEPEGYVPAIVPEYQRIIGLHRDPNWNGACVFTPWEYYQYYGDFSVLQTAYPAMKRYLTYLGQYLKNGVLEDYAHLGEWGELRESTPNVLVATCSFYRMLTIARNVAELLGENDDRAAFGNLAQETKKAFYAHPLCYNPTDGSFGNKSQASFGCVLYSGLVSDEKKAETANMLVEAVKQRDYHLSSGEVGLKQVFVSLAENGRNDIVYQMIMNKTAPSYRFFADAGMTTLPEYWNCDELWQGMVRSRNHAMMGHVKEWMNRYMLGVRALKPGFSEVLVHPWMPKEMEWMKGSVATPYGRIAVECRRKDGHIEQAITIPAGIRAIVEGQAFTDNFAN